MFRFKVDQKVFEIGGVKIGRGRGDNPPVLVGSIFYHKHRIVLDEKKGEFDRSAAEGLLKYHEEIVDKTKIPGLIDVVISSPEAAEKYVDFVSKFVDKPFLIDTPTPEVMSKALNYVREVGLSNRVVFNSLTPRSKDEELNVLAESNVKSAILLLYTSKIMDVDARLEALKELLSKVEKAGVTTPLIDTFVMDVPSLSIALRTILHVKSTYGLPCGCGAHNAVSLLKKKLKETYGIEGVEAAALASNIAPIILSADFVLYGPLEACKTLFPAAYVINTSYRYLTRKSEFLIEL